MKYFTYPLSGMRKEAAGKVKILNGVLNALRKAAPNGRLSYGDAFKGAEAANAAINYKVGNLTNQRIINALRRHNYDASQLPKDWLRQVKTNPRYLSDTRFVIPPQYTGADASGIIQLDRLPGITDDTVKLLKGQFNKGRVSRFSNYFGQAINATAEPYIKPFNPDVVASAEASRGYGWDKPLIDAASRGGRQFNHFTPPSQSTLERVKKSVDTTLDSKPKVKGFLDSAADFLRPWIKK